ncbi:MAG: nitroreductase [Gammaproteobacteria bacterium]|jgi:nitroreductase
MSEELIPFDLASVDHVLSTTRSVRLRLDFDREVSRSIIDEALEIALQAPTGANTQTWRFMVVTDPDLKSGIADYYRKGAEKYLADGTAMTRTGVSATREFEPEDLRAKQAHGVIQSSVHLLENMQRAPALIIPCIESRFENEDVFTQASMYGSILPATWSLMLALRARRIASAWTSLHLIYEKEVAGLLGIPGDVTQAALLPIAWLKGGDLRRAKRLPLQDVCYSNRWGSA